jgi:uridine phosphorylase
VAADKGACDDPVMLKDLRRADWIAALDLDPDRLPSVAVLRGTRNLRTQYARYREWFDDVADVGSPNGLFEDLLIGSLNGKRVGYASVYGGPMASEIAHLFGDLGCKLVIQTGVCGGLADGLLAGDLVIATSAGCGDGTSHCYLPGRETIDATPELVTAICAVPEIAVPRRVGPIWTTAALLAEGQAEADRWHDEGFVAVDMETSATFAVAEYFVMRRVSILSVFDNPRHGTHLLLTDEEKRAARAAGEGAMRAIIEHLIAQLPR